MAGVTILRYRLFDIDVLIGNAVPSALLTALVTGLYGGLTMLGQRLWGLPAGQQSDATLASAAALEELSAEVARLRAKLEPVATLSSD